MSSARKLDAKFNKETRPHYQWLRRILVVDDEKDIADSFKDILLPESSNVKPLRSTRSRKPEHVEKHEEEFEVVVVYTAEAALEEVRKSLKDKKPFAMGFFDVMLGGSMDGIELVHEIQKLDEEMNAVFVTAYNDRSVDTIRNLLGEAKTSQWDYMNKPFTKGEILQKARNFVSLWNLKRERALSQKKMAKVQRQLLESERSNSVAAISRGVTHEFGNILMQIMGKADISRGKEEADMRKALEVILDASQRAAKILDRFKNLSNTGNGENEKEMVDLKDVLEKAIDLMEFQFKDQQVKISRIRMESAVVPVNTTSLLQVIVNLIINSIAAMGDSGQLDFEITATHNYAELRIRDYGPGIKSEILEKVKEPFFTTKGKGGSGLGLAICNEIVQIEHGGEFIIRNHGVKGLEALIRLPLNDPMEDNDESTSA